MNCPNRLTACCYDEISRNTQLINKDQFPYWLWIQLPKCVLRDYELYQVDEFFPHTGECDWLDSIEREAGRPWLRIAQKMLNLAAGKHVYKLSFVNRYTNDTVDYYFSYILQDSCPEQPYIYMNRNIDSTPGSDSI